MANQLDTADPARLLGRMDNSAFTPRHTRTYVLALVGHFLNGFLINVTGVVLPGIVVGFHLHSQQAGFFSSSLFIGMLVGAAVAGLISDRLGRKYPLVVSLLVFACFSLLAAFAPNYGILVFARSCQGVGLGAEIAIVLPYITEFAPRKHRAPLLTTATAVWLLGLPVAAALGAAIVPVLSWRAMFVLGAIPILPAVVMVFALPESVRYLIRAGRHDGAQAVVDSLCSKDSGDVIVPRVDPSAQRAVGSVRELLRGRYLRYTVALWLIELCGGAFLYGLSTWLPSVLAKRGVGLLHSFTYTAIITAVGVVGSILAGQLVNRVGRRPVLITAHLLCGGFCLWWGLASSATSVVILGSLATFCGVGLAGSTVFAYAGELYPTYNRATGLGWVAAWQKAGGLVIPIIIGYLLATHGSNYWFFVLFCVLAVIAGISATVATFETRGKTVEQITDELAGHDPRAVPAPTVEVSG
jgi:putative MFS transporter